jgi:hypothetical protein
MPTSTKWFALAVALVATAALVGGARNARAQSRGTSAAAPPYIVEWVYRAQWGHKEEFFDLFKKYQVPVLDREKQLGYVTDYTIHTPSLHTSEDGRWDYRIIITYKDYSSSTHSGEITKQLFPDQATLKREENRRWEITVMHWDLPIRVVDPHSTE